MKALIVTSFACICMFTSSAQKTELIKVSSAEYPYFIEKNEYKYPVFTKAEIKFKDGNIAKAKINYNNFKNAMLYVTNADTLEIANPQDISYIAVGPDTVFYEDQYLTWVATSPTATLASKINYKVAYKAFVGAFGTASPAKQVEAQQVIMKDISTVTLSQNEEVAFTKETVYYIRPTNGKDNFVIATKKNIDKLFPKLKVENFIADNKLNLNKEEDLIDLMVYISRKKN